METHFSECAPIAFTNRKQMHIRETIRNFIYNEYFDELDSLKKKNI